MERPLSLRHNFAWTFAGNVVYAASQWGMITVLAKLGTPEIVGRFSLASAVAAPVIMFANLQLRTVQATDVQNKYVFGDYLGVRLITTSLAILVVTGFAFWGYSVEKAVVIFAFGWAKGIESISDIFYGLFQHHERMDCVGKSLMIKGPLSLLALGLGFYLTGNVLWGIVGLAFAWTMSLIVFDIRNGARILRAIPKPNKIDGYSKYSGIEGMRPRWHTKTLLQIVWRALPLGFVMMLISLNTNIPRYIIEDVWGEGILGIFSAMAYLTVAGVTVMGALGQSSIPRFAQYYAEKNVKAFRSLLFKIIGIGALLGGAGVIVAAIVGRDLLSLIYRPEYAEYKEAFIWIMVSGGVMYIAGVLGTPVSSMQKFRVQLGIHCLNIILVLMLSWFLITRYGLNGAAWTMLGSSIFLAVGYSLVILRALVKHQQQPT
jgi:O-antigen/teichoic acid export membrane protein